jgi:HIRAN domain
MQEKKKRMPGEKGAVIGELRVNLGEGTATLSGMMQSYKVRLKGVSHNNMDGTNRQSILSRCKIGEEVKLVREPENPKDKAAVAVYWRSEKLGYVPAGDKRLAIHMDAGFEVFAHIVAIEGGPSALGRLFRWRHPTNYGCVIQIDKGYKKIECQAE